MLWKSRKKAGSRLDLSKVNLSKPVGGLGDVIGPQRAAMSIRLKLGIISIVKASPKFSIQCAHLYKSRMLSTKTSIVSGLKDSTLIKTQGFIDGKWVDAKDGGRILVTNPANGDALGSVPEMGQAETKEAIKAAEKAFQTWGKTTAKVFRQFQDPVNFLLKCLTTVSP